MPTIPDITTPTSGPNGPAQAVDPTLYPYNSIVRITDTVGTGRYQGTGVLISADEVLTADHVSYKSGDGNGVATAINVELTIRAPGDTAANVSQSADYNGTVAHYFPIIDDPSITFDDLQTDYSIIHLSKPVVGGAVMRLLPDFAGGTVHVTGFPASASGAMIDDVQSISTDPAYTIYEGSAIGAGTSGAPVWITGPDGTPNLVGIVSSATADVAYDVKLTTDKAAQINAWVAADDKFSAAPPNSTPLLTPTPSATTPVAVTPAAPSVVTPPANPPVTIRDGKTGQLIADTLSKAYTGPVQGLLHEFIDITQQNLIVAANLPGLFIHTGGGDDAIALNSGTNVVDGGAGSNFLTAGTGADTFFVDARNAVADVWSTLSKFHSGDAATVWGLAPGVAMQWVDGAGAAGFTGLTLHAGSAGGPTASVTLAGLTRADLASGKLSAAFGHDAASGSDYLYIHEA